MARAWRMAWACLGNVVDAFSTTTCTLKSRRQARSRPATTGTTKNSEDRAPRSPAKPPDAPEPDRSWQGGASDDEYVHALRAARFYASESGAAFAQ
eukprot:11483376-Alexandrium_andersonii.AAC.1